MITVIAPDRPGLLAKITVLLAGAGLDLHNTWGQTAAGQALLHLATNDDTQALQLLHAAGFDAVPREALLVRVPNRPGALARIALRLDENKLDLRSISTIHSDADSCIVSLVTSDDAEARRLLGEDVLG